MVILTFIALYSSLLGYICNDGLTDQNSHLYGLTFKYGLTLEMSILIG